MDYVSMLVGSAFLQLMTSFNLLPAPVFIALAITLVILAFALRIRRSTTP
ncbi:MAG: hypothetical protein ABIS34_07730 [Opitutus sp.]